MAWKNKTKKNSYRSGFEKKTNNKKSDEEKPAKVKGKLLARFNGEVEAKRRYFLPSLFFFVLLAN